MDGLNNSLKSTTNSALKALQNYNPIYDEQWKYTNINHYSNFIFSSQNSYNKIFENFSINTCKKKRKLKTISNIVGISFGINTFTKLRDRLVSNFSDKLMCNFFKKVWYD